jgi:transcription factor TGA
MHAPGHVYVNIIMLLTLLNVFTLLTHADMQMLLSHVEPLTEQQIVGVYGLQQSALETEEALSQGLDALYQSLSDTVVSDALSCPSNVANYMGQMAAAMNKLSTLEGFVRQVSNQCKHR